MGTAGILTCAVMPVLELDHEHRSQSHRLVHDVERRDRANEARVPEAPDGGLGRPRAPVVFPFPFPARQAPGVSLRQHLDLVERSVGHLTPDGVRCIAVAVQKRVHF